MYEFGYEVVYGCGQGSVHQTCLALLIAERGQQDSGGSGGSVRREGQGRREYVAYVLEAPSMELAQAICAHIGKGSRSEQNEG